MHSLPPYSIFSSGDMAITIEFGHQINPGVNEIINTLYHYFTGNPFRGCIEVVPAYKSITIYYDPLILSGQVLNNETISATAIREIEKLIQVVSKLQPLQNREINVPVCYDPTFALDITTIADHTKMSPAKIIAIHCAVRYRVYMLGFLPDLPIWEKWINDCICHVKTASKNSSRQRWYYRQTNRDLSA